MEKARTRPTWPAPALEAIYFNRPCTADSTNNELHPVLDRLVEVRYFDQTNKQVPSRRFIEGKTRQLAFMRAKMGPAIKTDMGNYKQQITGAFYI